MQTFRQVIQSSANRKLQRKQVADALRRIADDLDAGVIPNPKESPWSMEDKMNTFEGFAWGGHESGLLGEKGFICIHFND